MTIINLTPHEVQVVLTNPLVKVIYAKSNLPVRIETFTEEIGTIKGFIPLFYTELGQVVNLPMECEDTLYIVSRMVKNACPNRKDFIIPSGLVRDENGVIIGCKGFE